MDEKIIQPQITTKKMDFHKVFAAVGIILIVLIIVVGGVWYFVLNAEEKVPVNDDVTVTKIATSSAKTTTPSATKDETADWKTVSNNTCGFSVKYPKDWFKGIAEGSTISLVNVEELGGDIVQSRISISCANEEFTKTEYTRVKTYQVGKDIQVKPMYQVDKEMDTYNRLDDKKFAGITSVRTKLDLGYKDVDASNTYRIFLEKGNIVNVAQINGGLVVNEKIELLDQIFSTFKFLD